MRHDLIIEFALLDPPPGLLNTAEAAYRFICIVVATVWKRTFERTRGDEDWLCSQSGSSRR